MYRFNFCIPNLESREPFDTGKDSKLAINKLIDAFSSSIYNGSISFRTNFGISFRFFSISPTRCIRPSNSRRMAAACSSAESSYCCCLSFCFRFCFVYKHTHVQIRTRTYYIYIAEYIQVHIHIHTYAPHIHKCTQMWQCT